MMSYSQNGDIKIYPTLSGFVCHQCFHCKLYKHDCILSAFFGFEYRVLEHVEALPSTDLPT